jgi:hypothetical protein
MFLLPKMEGWVPQQAVEFLSDVLLKKAADPLHGLH